MNKKLPSDAFDVYVALGDRRSYSAVAAHFRVDRKTVIRRAKAEDWPARLKSIEQTARRSSDQKLAESIEQMNDRHLATLRVIQGKALQALRSMPISAAMDAVRALDISIRGERLIRGEPTDRNATDVEAIIKREYERWMVREEDEAVEREGRAPVPNDSSANLATTQLSSPPTSVPPLDAPPRPSTDASCDDEEDDDDV